MQACACYCHKETPGLGDKIEAEKNDWILGFNGKSLQNPADTGWAVRKDGGEFDQFTGATITPRAVVKAVKRTLDVVTTTFLHTAFASAGGKTMSYKSIERYYREHHPQRPVEQATPVWYNCWAYVR